MAGEIVGTIENIDRLFSEIIVNGESHISENYVAPTPTETNHSTPSQSTSVQESESTEANPSPTVTQTQGEDVHAVELNHVLHDFSDPDIALDVQALQQGLANETSARTTTDQALDSAITQEANARSSADEVLQTNINTVSGNVSTLQEKVSNIESEIPSQASAQNKLADKNFVNSSISTNTANFLGTYTSMADIEAIPNPTNNDYVFLQTTDSAGNSLFDRYKYNADQEEWLFEYELNNSSFTAEQWATINSGLTQSVVTQEIADALASATVGHADEADKWATARDIKIQDSDGTNTGSAVSVDGSGNATLKLPSTIKASITGNCSGSSGSCTGNSASSDYSRQGAYCTTASATQAKVASMRGFAYQNGCAFPITFTNANSYNGKITLNINSTGAKDVWINGSVSSSSNKTLPAGTYICFCENGVYSLDTVWCVPFARNSSSASYATSAGKLSTARNLKVALASANAQSFDGSAPATSIGVGGTLPVGNGGTGQTSLANVSVGNAKTANNIIAWCSTTGSTTEKVATLPNFVLETGQAILLYMEYANTATYPTLNVNGTGAKTIRYNGTGVSTFADELFQKGLYIAKYNGTYWDLVCILSGGTRNSFNSTGATSFWEGIAVESFFVGDYNGYISFKNGLLLQWGRLTVSTSQGYALTYPQAFASANSYYVGAEPNSYNNNVMNCYNKTATGCTVNRASSASTDWAWFAIGRGA